MIESLVGTWEEIKQHDAELSGHKVRVTIIDEPKPLRTPNYAMLEAMRDAEEAERGIVPRQGADSVTLIRQARSGSMFGHEASE